MLTNIKLTVLRDLALDDLRSPSPNDLGKALLLAIAAHAGRLPEPQQRADHPPGYETTWKGYVALMHQSDAYQQLIHLAQEQGPDYIYKLAVPR